MSTFPTHVPAITLFNLFYPRPRTQHLCAGRTSSYPYWRALSTFHFFFYDQPPLALTLLSSFPTVSFVRMFCLALSLLALVSSSQAATPNLVNGIAVIVGDEVITYKDIQLVLAEQLDSLERRYGSNPQLYNQRLAELERATMEDMIENQLVLQEFKRAGYVIPESYFQSAIDREIRYFGDRLTFMKTLQAKGITLEAYRNKIRERLILQEMWRAKVPRDPLISPAKIENYYNQNKEKFQVEDQVKLRMIVLTNNPNDRAYSPLKIAEELVTKLDQKADFAELAKVYSQGSQAQDGGNWDWVERSVLNTNLAQVAFSLEPGQHSRAIETPAGAYILLVEDKKVSHVKPLTDLKVRDDIETTLRAEEMKRLRKQWVDQLKSKAFVRVF
jgi:peptidyl-prolyl cis-trans isomerase SurA